MLHDHGPRAQDGFTPYWPGLTEAEIRREERQAEKARRRFARLQRKEQKDWARYNRWVRKQLRIKKGQNTTLTPEQYDYYYGHPAASNKHFPWRWIYDHSGVYVPPIPPGAVAGGMSAQGADDVFQALNRGKGVLRGRAVNIIILPLTSSILISFSSYISNPHTHVRIHSECRIHLRLHHHLQDARPQQPLDSPGHDDRS